MYFTSSFGFLITLLWLPWSFHRQVMILVRSFSCTQLFAVYARYHPRRSALSAWLTLASLNAFVPKSAHPPLSHAVMDRGLGKLPGAIHAETEAAQHQEHVRRWDSGMELGSEVEPCHVLRELAVWLWGEFRGCRCAWPLVVLCVSGVK